MTEWEVEFDCINKSFFGARALSDVTFSIEKGQTLGLIGENGAGKSTLMNILGGIFPQDEGQIRLYGKPYNPECPADATREGIAFIHQELNLFTNLSIQDNLFIDEFPRLGKSPFINKRRLKKQAAELLSSVNMHIPAETPVEMLTLGERQLVEIARALSRDAHVIIFDEPTTSLTTAERKRLFDIIRKLQDQGRTIIYISHTLEDVLQVSDSIAILRDGCLVNTGSDSDYSIDKMISEMVGRRIEQMYPARSTTPGNTAVLKVGGLIQPGIVKDISFKLHEKEVLGIFGLMGSGRSELARIIFGLDSYKAGRISIKTKDIADATPAARISNGLAFVTENRHQEGLLLEATVAENIDLPALRKFTGLGQAGIINRSQSLKFANRIAERLKLKSGLIKTQKVRNLSGGNQQKVVIGKWLLTEPAVLILDEPTRGIDVGAKYEVYSTINKLTEEGVGILYISSELEELTGMCDRILVMSNGEIRAEFTRPDFDHEKILQAAFSGRKDYKLQNSNSSD